MSSEGAMSERVAVVTGGGTGIGRAIARRFAGLGWPVAIGGRRVERLQETANVLEKDGGRCFVHRLDVTDAASVQDFFDATEAELGPVSVAINNAAIGRYGPLDDFSPEEIHAEIATKLVGGLYVARRAIKTMRREGRGGDILFMTSASAAQPWIFHLPYASANAGVEHAAQILRLELEGTGIRINVLRCADTGGTEFSTNEQGRDRMAAAHHSWYRRGLLRHNGLMTPQMVADAVVTAVNLPPGHQYDFMSVMPTAPMGDLPATYEELCAGYVFDDEPES
jgi:NAD(P)-dependent dehydrogenase (short-subunit alcohol dehydrogenase family)